MLEALPGWVLDDAASVRDEVQEWIGTSPEDRWKIARLCSRDVMWALQAGGHRQRVLDHVDALPDSTLDALARLRRQAGWGDGSD